MSGQMDLQQELVDFSLLGTAGVMGKSNWITFHVELNVFYALFTSCLPPLGHYSGLGHVNTAELDLPPEKQWAGPHLLPAARAFVRLWLQEPEAPLPPCQEAVGPAEASIPTLERRDFLHRNSHAMYVWGEGKRAPKIKNGSDKATHREKKFRDWLGQVKKSQHWDYPRSLQLPVTSSKCQNNS